MVGWNDRSSRLIRTSSFLETDAADGRSQKRGRPLALQRAADLDFLSLMLNQEMKRFRASAPQVACIRSSLFPVLAFFRCGCKCPFPIATEPKVPCSKPCRCSRTNEAEVGKGISRKAECPFLLPCPKAKEKRFGLGEVCHRNEMVSSHLVFLSQKYASDLHLIRMAMLWFRNSP